MVTGVVSHRAETEYNEGAEHFIINPSSTVGFLLGKGSSKHRKAPIDGS